MPREIQAAFLLVAFLCQMFTPPERDYQTAAHAAPPTKEFFATGYDSHAGARIDEDPTGLLDEGRRYRDLDTGVFITRDPLGFKAGPNMYSYVVDNPWTKFDPEGLEPEEIPQDAFNVLKAVFEGAKYEYEHAPAQAAAVKEAVSNEIKNAPAQINALKKGAKDLEKTVENTAKNIKTQVENELSKIKGNAQKTGTPGHDTTSTAIAKEDAAQADTTTVHLNQTLKTITKGAVDSQLKPDVATVKSDGTVNVVEVPSKSQTPASQQAKVDKMQKLLGNKAGTNSRVEPIRQPDSSTQ